MADQRIRGGARGDEVELFRDHNDLLVRTVAGAVFDSTPEVIEDACAYAWAQFMEYQPDRERNWRGWLFRTAERQAWKLERQANDHVPLRAGDDERAMANRDAVSTRDDHAIRGRRRRALDRRAVAAPIATDRDVAGARAELRRHFGGDGRQPDSGRPARRARQPRDLRGHRRACAHESSRSPRAERLWELEHEQPAWLTAKIGPLPRASRRSVANSARRRAWRRAALALDDFRELVGPERLDESLASTSQEPALRGPFSTARRALDEFARASVSAASATDEGAGLAPYALLPRRPEPPARGPLEIRSVILEGPQSRRRERTSVTCTPTTSCCTC
jgi:hypothetical protein